MESNSKQKKNNKRKRNDCTVVAPTDKTLKEVLLTVLWDVHIPPPLIGIMTEYASPHDFKQKCIEQKNYGIFDIHTDPKTGCPCLMIGLPGIGRFAEYHTGSSQRIVRTHTVSEFSMICVDFVRSGYLYARWHSAVLRVNMTNGSVGWFTLSRDESLRSILTTQDWRAGVKALSRVHSDDPNEVYISAILPSNDPDVVYVLTRFGYYSNRKLFRINIDHKQNREIIDLQSIGMRHYGVMTWNRDRRLFSESEVWMSTSSRYGGLESISVCLSTGEKTTSFKTPDAVVCYSTEIMSISSGNVLFIGRVGASECGVCVIDPTTASTELVYASDAISTVNHIHEPSRTLFTCTYDSITSISLPSHLFPLQECTCGCR
jgi:hypothetical protein